MQKLIAKYGTAAHLALLAVAPLFLFPFFGASEIAKVLLWLSLPTASWMVLEPSLRTGESLHMARRRVLKSVIGDPLFWVSLCLVLLTGVRALNTGIALVYDAEAAKWNLAPSIMTIIPGSVKGTGFLPFAAMVAASILMQGCRHSLGRASRMAFLLLAASLAGLAAVIAIWVGSFDNATVRAAIACAETDSFYVGVAFYLHLLGGTVALAAAFERKWNLSMPLFVLAIGGTAAGGFLFSPVIVSLAFLSAELLLLGYTFVYSMRVLPSSGEFKLLVVSGISITLGGMLVTALESAAAMERINAVIEMQFIKESLASVRSALSGVALRAWLSNLWLGTGLGSFPLAFRFHATPEDMQLIRAGAQSVPNGWWMLLAERGIVGVLVLGLPVGFLGFTYGRRLAGWVKSRTFCHPGCCLGPLVLAAMAVTGLYSCAMFRADVATAVLALLAISANSFSRSKKKDNG